MKEEIELIIAIGMVIIPALMLIQRIISGKGIGVRVIQFTTVYVIFSIILILGLEGILSEDVIYVLLSAVIGYILGSIGAGKLTEKNN